MPMNEYDSSCDEKRFVPTIVLGEDKPIVVRLVDAVTKNPVDLTSATEITAELLKDDGTGLTLTKTAGQIVLNSGPGGNFTITISAAQTALLAPSPATGYSSIQVSYTIAGKLTIVQLLNCVQIVPSLFP